jgi:hypothetical protein
LTASVVSPFLEDIPLGSKDIRLLGRESRRKINCPLLTNNKGILQLIMNM